MIERMRAELVALPGLLRIGLLVFLLASALDLLYHSAPLAWVPALDTYLGPDGYWVHLMIMAGMIIIILGLIESGLTAGKRSSGPAQVEGKQMCRKLHN